LTVSRASRFIWPAEGAVTSYFGLGHPTGIDIGLDPSIDTPVRASAAGTVRFAGGPTCCSYGLHVVLDHGDDNTTLYGHLSQILVEVGQEVAQGDVLGLGGSTGESDGKHLHFEIELGGAVFDPLRFLAAEQANRGDSARETASCAAPLEVDPASVLSMKFVSGGATLYDVEQVTLTPLTARTSIIPQVSDLGEQLEVNIPVLPVASGETYLFRLEAQLKDGQSDQTLACDLTLKTRKTLPNPLTQRRAAGPPPPTPTPTPLRWTRPTFTPRPVNTPIVPGRR
jgi:pyruvate/2-oxoglutarate dehydrogenase complex dihydrolipoamide acyltransferase (E2) component